ncbi:DNA primase isoform 2 [Hibiscus syriacus]|uniref:DNA primase n=1 Tax=Hibiscus syriacus TaxID=106335 RepID=A0A6A2WS05_HIBSY|nr:DNA primase isoform 2 [Hibiscus syriacus]
MENSIKEKCPFKIDIGPVYSVDPAKRHAYAQSGDNVFTPVERELVFDVDITDYDDVRYCCTGADVFLECWPLMTIAIKVIDTALRVVDMVCTAGAMKIVTERRSYTEVLEGFFEAKLLPNQNLLSCQERYEKILEMIPDASVASELRGRWQENKRASMSKDDINHVRWEQLKFVLQSGKQKTRGLRRCVEEVVFSFTYPRLDMEGCNSITLFVSKHMNHLLKAPFCVHPKTGRVCVPIDPNNCDEFDPTTVPTLSQLLEELNRGGLRQDAKNEWDGTSLGESVKFFRTSFLQPLLKSCKEEIESSYNAKLQQSKNTLSW